MIDKKTKELIDFCVRNIELNREYPILIGPMMIGRVVVAQKVRNENDTGFQAELIGLDRQLNIEIKIGEDS